MAVQMSLFDEKNLHQTAFLESLRKFDLAAAVNNLEKWERTFKPPVDLNQKLTALLWLDEQLSDNQKQAVNVLAWLLTNLENIDELKALRKEQKHLRKGLSKTLYDLLPDQATDFISDDLHPAEIFIEQDDFKAALRSLNAYFDRFGEHPFLRELQAYVLWQQKQKHEALVLYTFALFADPFALQERYLQAKTFQRKWQYLRQKFADEAKARAHLPFALWQDGQTYIESDRPSFEKFVSDKLEHLNATSGDLITKMLRFNALLFLAESERLRAYPNTPGERFEKLVNEMRSLHYEKTAIYLDTLKAFRNI